MAHETLLTRPGRLARVFVAAVVAITLIAATLADSIGRRNA
jgi:hypothetical protein